MTGASVPSRRSNKSVVPIPKTAGPSFVLNPYLGVTRYVQLANFVRKKIADNAWPAGSALPTVQALADQLGIARITVRQAYAILVRENLITTERGRGSHVREVAQPPADAMRAAINDWLDVPEAFQIRILKTGEAMHLPEELRLAGRPAAKYVRLTKSHLHNQRVYFVADFYVASEVFARFPRGSEKKNKITGLLTKYAPDQMESLRHVTTVSQADGELARMLDCSFGAPVAIVRRCVTSRAGTIVYASTTHYRGDHFIFDMSVPVHVMYATKKSQ